MQLYADVLGMDIRIAGSSQVPALATANLFRSGGPARRAEATARWRKLQRQ